MKKQEKTKSGLHPRNTHRERYDFPSLIHSLPSLKQYVSENKYGDLGIDFANPKAVKELNKALLKHFYQISNWNIPEGYLCPPIPGRADYIHHVADLLAQCNADIIPEKVHVLDIGTGANCIYPILGNAIYDWSFVGTDIDIQALQAAQKTLGSNPKLQQEITLRYQENTALILKGIIRSDDVFDISICNPPFHESQAEAEAGSRRKVKNLKGKVAKKVPLNFGGQSNELWCEGGELSFIKTMIKESVEYKYNCFWFTSLVSKEEQLKELILALKKARVSERKIIDMAHGNKKSRILAWTFLSPEKQENWRRMKWNKG